MGKPYDNHDSHGVAFNYPLPYDASDTPVESPVAGGATATLTVHRKAGRINLLASGSNAATVTVMTGATEGDGAITIPTGVQVQIDLGGMNSGMGTVPDGLKIVAGATSPVSFWFDSTTPTGE